MERLSEILGKWFKFFGVILLILVVAGTSLEFLVPIVAKEPLRMICIKNLQDRLGRQVKLSSVSIGPWRGLRVEGLSISEAPDFAAGTWLEAERLTVKVKYFPLLTGRIVSRICP